MQRKFRLNDETWNAFLEKTSSPSDTLRELVNNYLNEEYPLNTIIGVQEASELWGLSAGHIKNLCAAGQIKCKKIGQTWIIDKNQDNPKNEND